MIALTNPGKDMLLGFSLDTADAYNNKGEVVTSVDVFSLGLFFLRIDFMFNEFIDEDKLNEMINDN